LSVAATPVRSSPAARPAGLEGGGGRLRREAGGADPRRGVGEAADEAALLVDRDGERHVREAAGARNRLELSREAPGLRKGAGVLGEQDDAADPAVADGVAGRTADARAVGAHAGHDEGPGELAVGQAREDVLGGLVGVAGRAAGAEGQGCGGQEGGWAEHRPRASPVAAAP
jgi:hypothetical protein